MLLSELWSWLRLSITFSSHLYWLKRIAWGYFYHIPYNMNVDITIDKTQSQILDLNQMSTIFCFLFFSSIFYHFYHKFTCCYNQKNCLEQTNRTINGSKGQARKVCHLFSLFKLAFSRLDSNWLSTSVFRERFLMHWKYQCQ